jgi:hypothetical protein
MKWEMVLKELDEVRSQIRQEKIKHFEATPGDRILNGLESLLQAIEDTYAPVDKSEPTIDPEDVEEKAKVKLIRLPKDNKPRGAKPDDVATTTE